MEYTKHEIAELIKRPVGTIKHWTDRGVLFADAAPARGKGYARLYTFRNLLEAAIIDYLNVDLGVSLDQIGMILRDLKEPNEELDGITDFLNKKFSVSYEYVISISPFVKKNRRLHRIQSIFCANLDEVGKFSIGDWFQGIFDESNVFSVYKMGDIRNKAMQKHNITWAENLDEKTEYEIDQELKKTSK
jgi:DNA-binding transcriptional MerR regulator